MLVAGALIPTVLVAGRAEASPTLNEWVAANASTNEKTLCTREESGEFFFIALASPNRVRVGSRIDMTGYGETQEFGTAWIIGNEKAGSIVAKVQPSPIKERYVREGAKFYADNIEYQTLSTGESALLRVDVRVHKCRVWSPSSNTCDRDLKSYAVKVCETRP